MYRDIEQIRYLSLFLQSGMLFFGLLMIAIMAILCFGRDRIARPRLFNWGAILFTVSVVFPIVCGTFLAFMQVTNSRGGPEGIGMIIGLLLALVMMLAPLLFSLGLLFMVIGLTTPYREIVARRRIQNRQTGAVAPTTLPTAQVIAEPTKPHPLD